VRTESRHFYTGCLKLLTGEEMGTLDKWGEGKDRVGHQATGFMDIRAGIGVRTLRPQIWWSRLEQLLY